MEHTFSSKNPRGSCASRNGDKGELPKQQVGVVLEGATPAQVHHNIIFEKVEKIFFLIIDLGLNLYFLYLVRYRLIEDGLGKYWRLFNFNAGMVGISTTMDILLLGFLSLPNPYL